jgi:dihydropteroate synthase
MLDVGAQIVDVGAESTRPGATPLNGAEEWSRLEPVLERLAAKLEALPLRPLISVDTYHADVARRSLAAGADIINDIGGLTSPAMIDLAAGCTADFVAMHSVTVPADRGRTLPTNADPIDQVRRWLDSRLAEWEAAGIALERVIFDPGIGFGKNPLQSLELLRNTRQFRSSGLRCLVGHSRKSFMQSVDANDAVNKDLFTLGASLNLCAQGVDIIRIHDVPAHVAAYRGWAHLL